MTTLIERGAIALLRKEYPDMDWRAVNDRTRSNYLDLSRTCLEAFREPSKEMIYAGDSVSEDAGEIWEPSAGIRYGGPQCGRDVWQAMVNAELETDT